MSEVKSLTIDKGLISRLKLSICCSESLSTCRDDDFCSSNPAKWPIAGYDEKKVRLSYPTKEGKTLPGIEHFAEAYLDWYTQTGCGELAKDIATIVSDSDHTSLFSDKGNLHEPLRRIKDKLTKRCCIMYDDDDEAMVFNPNRAEDLKNLADFSTGISEAQKGTFDWKTFAKGGGAIGGTTGVIYIIGKIIKVIRKGGRKIKETGKGVKDATEGLDMISNGLKRFFGTSIPNFGRTMKYVFTFGWVRGKDPPKDIEEERNERKAGEPKTLEEQPNLDNLKQKPHANVVMIQFIALSKSNHHAKEGKRFGKLSKDAQKYLVELAIQRWCELNDEKRQMHIEEDERLTEGKLPIQFLLKFVRKYLGKEAMLKIIEASADIWTLEQSEKIVAREEPAKPEEFNPEEIHVKGQMIHIPRFNNLSERGQDYVARLAISEWRRIPREYQQNFISVNDHPETGGLPQNFIRLFRKRQMKDLKDIKDIEIRQAIYVMAKRNLPETTVPAFYVIDRRLKEITKAWKELHPPIQEQFGKLTETDQLIRGEIPSFFALYMLDVISIGTNARPEARASSEPWRSENAPEERYKKFDITEIMLRLSTLNKTLKLYPNILRTRAISTVEGWINLPDRIRAEFALINDPDLMRGLPAGYIPNSFVEFIHRVNSGVGVKTRQTIAAPIALPNSVLPPPIPRNIAITGAIALITAPMKLMF